MEITPGRAPFTEDEDYTPLRKPKSAANTPTHQAAHTFNVGGMGGMSGTNLANNFGGVFNQPTNSNDAGYARTVSPSTLSPFAKEFVPRFGGSASGAQERLEQQQRHQQQYNQQNYQQYQHQRQQQHQQPRYANGYQQNHHHHHHQQQQQQQHLQRMYAPQIASLTASVQDRLKIGVSAGGSGASNKNSSSNYYQHSQQQHQPRNNLKHNHHQHHHQQQQHHHHHHHHHQNRYQHSNAHNQAASTSGTSGSGAEVETIALDYLQSVIQCLNQNPGQFDSIATRFLTIFDGMENNQYVLSNAMEDIFQQSIQNPNFRYMGAKLYNLLHMLNLKKDSLFHTLLKCKLDYHQQEVVQYMQTNQQQKVRETALFLAELYMQLRGDDMRIHLIAENIVYSLKQLLSKESTDNVRCICLTLKLAGYDLTADCPTDMQDIIAQLDDINVKCPGKYPLAANVISLQKNNWGRKVSSSNSMSDADLSKPAEPLRTSDEPIFYGPDGRELTAEETDFLSGDNTGLDGAGAGSTDDDDDDGDLDIDLDPEMDEETEKAYKEFCKNKATT